METEQSASITEEACCKMYHVFADDMPLLAVDFPDKEFHLLKPVLKEDIGKVATFSFTILPSHPMYNRLDQMKSEIKILKNNQIIFIGRILDVEKGNWLDKKITCESALSYLNDTWIDAMEKTNMTTTAFFMRCIQAHNSTCSPGRELTVGTINIPERNVVREFKIDSPGNILSVLNSTLVNKFGGYLRVRYADTRTYVDYVENYNHESTQPIQFSVNLKELEDSVDGSGLFSAFIPTGKEGLKITEAATDTEVTLENGTVIKMEAGSPVITIPSAVDRYGMIYRTNNFGEVDSSLTLIEEAKKWIRTNYREMPKKITIGALDLTLVGEATDSIACGDTVTITSQPHGIVGQYICQTVQTDILNPDNTTYTFGDAEQMSSLSASGSGSVTSAVAKAQGEIKGLVEWNAVINSQINVINSEINVINSAINVINSDINIINSEINIINSKINIINSNLNIINSDINIINSKLNIINSELNIINSEINVVNSKINVLNSEINVVNSKINTINSEINIVNSKINTINSTINTVNSNINTINSNINTVNSNIQTVNSNIRTLNSNVSTINSTVMTMSSTVVTLNSQIATINSNVTTINSNISTINSNIKTLNTKISTINSDISTLDSSITTVNSNISTINTRINNTNTSITNLNTRINNTNTTVSTLNTKVYNQDTYIAALNTSVTAMNTTVTTVNTKVYAHDSSLTLINSDISAVNGKIDALGIRVGTVEANLITADRVKAILTEGNTAKFGQVTCTNIKVDDGNMGGTAIANVVNSVSVTDNGDGTYSLKVTKIGGGSDSYPFSGYAAGKTAAWTAAQKGSKSERDRNVISVLIPSITYGQFSSYGYTITVGYQWSDMGHVRAYAMINSEVVDETTIRANRPA